MTVRPEKVRIQPPKWLILFFYLILLKSLPQLIQVCRIICRLQLNKMNKKIYSSLQKFCYQNENSKLISGKITTIFNDFLH